MPDALDEQLDTFLGADAAEAEADGEDDAHAPMHAPEQRPDLVLGRREEIPALPEHHLPV